MTLTPFTPGTGIKSSEVNANFNFVMTQAGINLIRQLQDRTVDFSAGALEGWAEAYIDSNGRKNSVGVGALQTTAGFSTDKYQTEDVGDIDTTGLTTHDPDTFTSPSNAFDQDRATHATETMSSNYVYLGQTFSARTVKKVHIRASVSGTSTVTLRLETYDGATWSIDSVLDSGSNETIEYDQILDLSSSVQGLRVSFESTAGPREARLYVLNFTTGTNSIVEVEHIIPTGTFGETCSSAIGVPLIADWEDGADIDYKLTNATEDTGWLSCSNAPSVSLFTAFTSEPTTLLVRLTPKTTSPTAGYPSIKGFFVRAE